MTTSVAGRPAEPGSLFDVAVERLDNGLQVCLLEDRRAPIVTTALWYRVGTRDELAEQGGIAHFLEHMMFKGSSLFGPGEIDRLTQQLGGHNNAFTSHDATVYYFQFAGDRWAAALDVEADRMRALELDPEELERERQVVLEEIAMYEDEPWDALDRSVQEALFAAHPYGRPVLGTRTSLKDLGADDLREFHLCHYGPDNAVLVLAGDLPVTALSEVKEHFAGLEPRGSSRPPAGHRREPPAASRIELRKGEIGRFEMAMAAPTAEHPDHALLRLLLTVLTGGRSGRLQRELVEERQWALWVSSSLSESQGPGCAVLAAELVPGIEPATLEQAVVDGVNRLVREGPKGEEIERARRILLADWYFGHDRLQERALLVGAEHALFSPGHFTRYLDLVQTADADDLRRAAERWLSSASVRVMGWSLSS